MGATVDAEIVERPVITRSPDATLAALTVWPKVGVSLTSIQWTPSFSSTSASVPAFGTTCWVAPSIAAQLFSIGAIVMLLTVPLVSSQ